MRPHELDYSDTRKHYFDISNGEVLVGVDDRRRYLAAGAEAAHVMLIGVLLRDPEAHIDFDAQEYEPLDTSDWPPERYREFARWLHRNVDPPKPPVTPQTKKVTKAVFRHARLLGVGPGAHAIKREFGNHSSLYREARLPDTHTIGTFDEWGVDEAVAYIKRVGARGGKRPSTEDLRRLHSKNPNNPTAEFLWDRFQDIGGFNRLLDLAGYPTVKAWDREDYIGWGVRFMRANDGQMPTARMANYLSIKDRGPSASSIIDNFDFLRIFQAEVVRRYYEYREAFEANEREQLQKIEAAMKAGTVPLELFSPFPYISEGDEDKDEERAAIAQKLELLYGDREVVTVVDQLGTREAIVRYGKFKVVEEVAPWVEPATKLKIGRGLSEGSFMASVRDSWPVPEGDIEYAALVEGVFDYIWPDDESVEVLLLDEDFDDYKARLESADRERRRARKKAAAATA